MPTFNTVESHMMRLSLKALFFGLVLISVFVNHRPDHLLSVAKSIDNLVQDSLIVSRRDYQCYLTYWTYNTGLVPIHIRRWCFGEKRFYFSDQEDKNEQYDSIIRHTIPYLLSVIKLMDHNRLPFFEITDDYIFGTTSYDRKGQTRFLYPRDEMNIEAIDSLLRHCMWYDHRSWDTIPIKGDESLRYVVVP